MYGHVLSQALSRPFRTLKAEIQAQVSGVNKLAPEQVCHSVALFLCDNYHPIGVSDNVAGGGGQNRPWVLGTLIYESFKLERRGILV